MTDTEKLLTLGAVAVGGYFVYTSYFAGALPADAVYAGTLPIGSLFAVPQSFSGDTPTAGSATTAIAYIYSGPAEGLNYLSYTAPTAAQYTATTSTASSTGSTATASTAAGSSTAAPVGPAPIVPAAPASTATYPLPGGGTAPIPTTLAGLWSAMQAWAATDSNFTGTPLTGSLDHWNFYLTYIWPTAPAGFTGVWPPNLAEVFPSNSGITGSSQISGATYWAAMEPYLQQEGLSGIVAGLGCACGGGGILDMAMGVTLGTLAVLGVVALCGGRQA